MMTEDKAAKTMELKLGHYRHYKGGLYRLIGVARHSETGEQLAVYRPCYGDEGLWVRPLSMFLEQVSVAGVWVSRFSFQDEAD